MKQGSILSPMKYLVCPGQGSQKPGFLAPWLEVGQFKKQIERHSEITGLDLIHLGTAAAAEEISQTSITQPLIVSASIASARTVFGDDSLGKFDAMAGHSVGEFAAAALAGVISDEQALMLVSKRAKAMQTAAEKVDTGMAAAVGSDVAALQEKLGELEIANYNGANQYVVAGEVKELERLKNDPPEGFRVIPLAVSGAFHTKYMEPAKTELEDVFTEVVASEPRVKLLSNKDGQAVSSGEEFIQSLLGQVSAPVRWDKCMATMNEATVSVEAAPAGVLSNLLKKTLETTEIYSLKSPTDSIDLGTND